KYKDVIINSLEYLTTAGKIEVYAFVIMPNHIHLIWRTKELNGKETAQGSFLKYTAHEFRKMTKSDGCLNLYKTNVANKQHEFWQRDSLAIHLYSREVAFQKLKYIHNNPLAEHWQLAKHPCGYKYSSAKYYEWNEKNFSFLKDLWNVF
ncbi:MAG: transposase, partial [Niabella sp.]